MKTVFKVTKPCVTVETITPEIAEQLLSMNTGNFRSLDPRRVEAFALDLRNHRWSLTGDTIKLHNGLLIDGQHRLAAVVKSGIPMMTAVAHNLSSDAISVDRGKPRTPAQWLTHQGIKNATNIASAARLCLRHDDGLWNKEHHTPQEDQIRRITEYTLEHNDSLQSAHRAVEKLRHLAPKSVLTVVAHIGSGRIADVNSNETMKWFIDALHRGENLTATDPPLLLKEWLIANKSRTKAYNAYYTRMIITLAWNNCVWGQSMTARKLQLRLTGPHKQIPPNMILVAETTSLVADTTP